MPRRRSSAPYEKQAPRDELAVAAASVAEAARHWNVASYRQFHQSEGEARQALDLLTERTEVLEELWADLAAAFVEERRVTAHASRPMAEKTDALAHIAYEVQMCAEAAIRCAQQEVLLRTGAVRDQAPRNAYLESSLMHARGLYEFLIKDKRRPRDDDMLREDFGPAWKAAPGREVEAKIRLAAWLPDAYMHLAHLTWRRVDEPDQHEWTPVQIASDIINLSRGWAVHIAAAAEGDSFGEATVLINALDTAEKLSRRNAPQCQPTGPMSLAAQARPARRGDALWWFP
jgi:hypothetical protein